MITKKELVKLARNNIWDIKATKEGFIKAYGMSPSYAIMMYSETKRL